VTCAPDNGAPSCDKTVPLSAPVVPATMAVGSAANNANVRRPNQYERLPVIRHDLPTGAAR